MNQVIRHAKRKSLDRQSMKWAFQPYKRRFQGRARPSTTTIFLLFCLRIANSTFGLCFLRTLSWLTCKSRHLKLSHLSSFLLWSLGPPCYLWVDTRKYSIIFSFVSPPPFARSEYYNLVSSPRASWESFDSLLLFLRVRVSSPHGSNFSFAPLWYLAVGSSVSCLSSPGPSYP